MLAARAEGPGRPLTIVELPEPEIGSGEILLRVIACGVCHSDLHIVDGDWSKVAYPVIPGHEVVGVVERVAADVAGIGVGDRVGVPWIYSACGECDACRRGDEPMCEHRQTTGLTVAGGYSELMKVAARSVTKIPPGLSAEVAAPLFCAGLTSYSALKLAGVRPGERVGVHGIGGLGHIAIQLAAHRGAHVVALTGSASKRDLCHELGAHEVLVGSSPHLVERLAESGDLDVLFSSSPDTSMLGSFLPHMAGNGRLVIVGAGGGTMSINPKDLIHRRLRIMGSPVGTRAEMEELLALAAAGVVSVRSLSYPLHAVNDALARLREGDACFRLVLAPRADA